MHLACIKGYLKEKYNHQTQITGKKLTNAQITYLYRETSKKTVHEKLYTMRKMKYAL